MTFNLWRTTQWHCPIMHGDSPSPYKTLFGSIVAQPKRLGGGASSSLGGLKRGPRARTGAVNTHANGTVTSLHVLLEEIANTTKVRFDLMRPKSDGRPELSRRARPVQLAESREIRRAFFGKSAERLGSFG